MVILNMDKATKKGKRLQLREDKARRKALYTNNLDLFN